MFDYLNHLDRGTIAKAMARWNIRVIMAKSLFWVSAGVALLIWAFKS